MGAWSREWVQNAREAETKAQKSGGEMGRKVDTAVWKGRWAWNKQVRHACTLADNLHAAHLQPRLCVKILCRWWEWEWVQP